MKTVIRPCSFVLLFLAFTFVAAAGAGESPQMSRGGDVVHGGNPALAKAGADTINLMAASDDPTNNTDPRDGGLEPYYDGDFSDAAGLPDWNGWTHYDAGSGVRNQWQVSNYQQPDPANLAAWCGDILLAACSPADVDGGYGNNWHQVLEFRRSIPDPGSNTLVTVTATLIHDTEQGYDYTHLSCSFEGQAYTDLAVWEGAGTEAVNRSVTYKPGDYLEGTDIAVQFRFTSDAGHSDEDCAFPSAGACQVDDINVHLENGAYTDDYFEDFESGSDPLDFGQWEAFALGGMGDFAKIWTGLEDLDACATNYTPQVAFIDDGVVVPGTGGSLCLTWCYGPGGYIVNTTGGLGGGPNDHLLNVIESPVMDWPAPKDVGSPTYDGVLLEFDVYVHEDLSAASPGMFYTWAVRSADTDASGGFGVQVIESQPWEDRNLVYYGGPEYRREGDWVADLMNPGRDEIQVQLAVYELGWVWFGGDDGTPAPYFDNVTVKVFPAPGPAMSAREIDLAQDNFPERGDIDLGDPGSHHVRFDMAANISPPAHLRHDPGDSIVVRVLPFRAGADLDGPPLLHYVLQPNPMFDAYRTAGLPASGSVAGMPAVNGPGGTPEPGQWAFDLPDTGFLFPGDVLHYLISGTDAIGGPGGTDPQTALLPPDTTGFSTGFGHPQGYDPLFTLRALPTLAADKDVWWPFMILFIDDGASPESLDRWYQALDLYGLEVGVRDGYDVFHVNGPASGVGNGIGGRATPALLAEYTDILYTSGELSYRTIANGDFDGDPGDDVGTLAGWLDLGDRDLFLAGDGLAGDLDGSGPAAAAFLADYMGVHFVDPDVRRLIGNQVAPQVGPAIGDPIFPSTYTWIANGGCPGINRFDAVEAAGSGYRSAEFLSPGGIPGYYPYAAVTRNGPGTSKVISMPMDLGYLSLPSGSGFPASATVLHEIMGYMGIPGPIGDAPGGLPQIVFQAASHPNPFNPRAIISYSLPRAGHLKLSIYDVRGQLIKTLIDGHRPAGADQTVVWDGTDNLGSAAASGLYFYEARAAGEKRTGKMTLLR